MDDNRVKVSKGHESGEFDFEKRVPRGQPRAWNTAPLVEVSIKGPSLVLTKNMLFKES